MQSMFAISLRTLPCCLLPCFLSRRYEEEMYWRQVEDHQLYWEEQQRRRFAADWRPPPLMGRPGVPVPSLLVGNQF